MNGCARLATLTAALLCALPAQQSEPDRYKPRRRREASTARLYDAWLREQIDLDYRGAAQQYGRVLEQTSPRQPARWIAATRLLEMHRSGVLRPEPQAIQNPPDVIARAVAKLDDPVPWEDLCANPYVDLDVPFLRPATDEVIGWLRNQLAPTVTEQIRRAQPTRRRPSPAEEYEWRRRWNAVDVLLRELEGRDVQAHALRTIRFPDWQPPQLDGDAADILDAVRERLKTWINRESWSRQRAYLHDLQKGLEERAERSPQAAIDLILRLPLYAERLLGTEPLPEADDEPAATPNGTARGDATSTSKPAGDEAAGGKQADQSGGDASKGGKDADTSGGEDADTGRRNG